MSSSTPTEIEMRVLATEPQQKILLQLALNDLESKFLVSEMLGKETISAHHVTNLKIRLESWLNNG